MKQLFLKETGILTSYAGPIPITAKVFDRDDYRFLKIIAKTLNLDIDKVQYDEFIQGIIQELTTAQVFTTESLSDEKLAKAAFSAYQNLMSEPNYYSNSNSSNVVNSNGESNFEYGHPLAGNYVQGHSPFKRPQNINVESIIKEELSKLLKEDISDKLIKYAGDKLDVNWEKIPFAQLKKGIEDELEEHGRKAGKKLDVIDDHIIMAAKIALSHLLHDPHYYNLNENKLYEGRKFLNTQEFKKIYGWGAQDLWLNKNGELIGRGSSRRVYLINSSKVLKFAINGKGYAQNKAEVDVYTTPKLKPLFAKIYDYGPDYSWIISELTRPLSTGFSAHAGEQTFKQMSGHDFRKIVASAMDVTNHTKYWNYYDHEAAWNARRENYERIPLVKALIEAEGILNLADLNSVSQWGKTSDNRIVILDYGFTHDVNKNHYSDI